MGVREWGGGGCWKRKKGAGEWEGSALHLERQSAKITSSGGGQMSVYNVFACASTRAVRLPFRGEGISIRRHEPRSLQTAYRAAGGCMWGWWWWWGGVGEKEMGVSHERRWAEERWRASRGIGHSCFLIEPPNTPPYSPPPPARHSYRHTAAACVQLESTQQFPPQPADGSEALSTLVWQQPSDGERRVASRPLCFLAV